MINSYLEKLKNYLIFGLSGSGKSNTGNYIAGIYNLKLYQIDSCWNGLNRQKIKDGIKFTICARKMILNKNNHIVDGLNILDTYSLAKFIIKQSCIMGRSALNSSFKAAKRGSYVNDDYFDNLKIH